MSLPILICCLGQQGFATGRYYQDIAVTSPSNRFEITAKSPANAGGGFAVFQSNFQYTCRDTQTDQVLWTRKQNKLAPPDEKGKQILRADEGSPISIYVNDDAWTVIRTGFDELVFVDPAGKDRGKVSILKQSITEEENASFVHKTTAGPRWSGYSRWYFLNIEQLRLFVIRPWWGRRMVFDLEKGQVHKMALQIETAAIAEEKRFVLKQMKFATANESEEVAWDTFDAAYLAGVLNVSKTVPGLRELELSDCCGSYTIGGFHFDGKLTNGDVDPHCYSTFTLRQVVQLSLRRLGEAPRPLPCYQFEIKSGDEMIDFELPTVEAPRQKNVNRLIIGMPAKFVLSLLGSPDFIGDDTWSYEIGGSEPYSVTLTLDVRKVIKIERHPTPLWKVGFTRDREVVE